MASPQKENGYTSIANEILEALARIRISGESQQVLNVIFRKTYGFHKKEDAIALSQFVLATGLKKTAICKAVTKLVSMNLITKKDNSTANLYRFNKDYSTWKPLPKKITLPKKIMVVTKKGNNRYQKRDIQKIKETITKDIPEQSSEDLLKINKTMKKNTLGSYNESASADAYEESIDVETGAPIEYKKTNLTKDYREMLNWVENRRGGGFKFVNIPKQYAALKKARLAGITRNELKNRWSEFEVDKFRQEKGFDWADVVNSFDKKR